MKHFVVYHNKNSMGYELKPSCHGTGFLTNKSLTFLRTVLDQQVWMITGINGAGNQDQYHLVGFYITDEIKESSNHNFAYWIGGKKVTLLKKTIELNNFEWFWKLFNSQGSFAYGLSEVKDKEVIAALEELMQQA